MNYNRQEGFMEKNFKKWIDFTLAYIRGKNSSGGENKAPKGREVK